MKLGIVSDTHDNLEKTQKAVNLFESQPVDTVIHCGDMIAPFTAELFEAKFDFHYVRGNNDGEWNLKNIVEQFGTFYNNTAELNFQDQSFAVYHGTEEELVESLINSGKYDYVLRGHTHKRKHEEHGDTVEINPGGIKLPGQDEAFFVAILDVETGEINFYSEEELPD